MALAEILATKKGLMIAKIVDRCFDKIEEHLTIARLFLVAAATALVVVSALRMIRVPYAHGDFGVYLHAARLMASGQNIYVTPTTHPFSDRGLFYLYPPLLAFLLIPLTYLPENVSIVLWCLLNVALLFWIAPAAFEIVSGRKFSALAVKTRWEIGLLSVLLTGRFIQHHFDRGQTNLLELALLLLGIQLITRGKWSAVVGGAVIGASVALKVLTAPYLIWQALQRQAKELAGACAGLAIGLILPAMLIGWKANLHLISFWFRNFALNAAQRDYSLDLGYNYSIRAVLLRLFTPVVAFERGGHEFKLMIVSIPPRWIDAAEWTFRLAIVAVVILYWFRVRRSSNFTVQGGGTAISCAAIPLLFPTAQQNYFVFLLPTLIYLMYLRFGLELSDSWFQGWIAAYVLLGPMTVQGIAGRFVSDVSVALGCVPIGVLCLMCAAFRASTLLSREDTRKAIAGAGNSERFTSHAATAP